MVRVVQLSDTHLSHRRAHSVANVAAALRWINAERPDLVVHTGDITADDPDDAGERAFAHRFLTTGLDVPMAVIPGNHDTGGFTDDLTTPERTAAFAQTWGSDTFVRDVGAWRLVGANVYRLGEPAHDTAIAAALATDRPIALFLHQPPWLVGPDTADDGDWSLSMPLRRRLGELIDGRTVAVIASGHLHRVPRTAGTPTIVHAPSAAFTGEHDDPTAEYPVGVVLHELDGDGGHRAEIVEPPGSIRVAFADFAGPDATSMRQAPLFPYDPSVATR